VQNFNGLPAQQWAPSMAFVGYHLYVSMTGPGAAPGNALYRWSPATGATPHTGGGGGGGGSTTSGPTSGQTAGAVIGILVGLTNLGFLIFIAYTLKAFAACGCGRGGGPKVDGFYTSAATAAAVGDAYAPPAM
jgi:hypothetical protein